MGANSESLMSSQVVSFFLIYTYIYVELIKYIAGMHSWAARAGQRGRGYSTWQWRIRNVGCHVGWRCRGIWDELVLPVAASRCTQHNTRGVWWGTSILPLVCSQQEFGFQPWMPGRQTDGNLRGNPPSLPVTVLLLDSSKSSSMGDFFKSHILMNHLNSFTWSLIPDFLLKVMMRSCHSACFSVPNPGQPIIQYLTENMWVTSG